MLTTTPTSQIPIHKIHWKKIPAKYDTNRILHPCLRIVPDFNTVSGVKLLDGNEVAPKENDGHNGSNVANPWSLVDIAPTRRPAVSVVYAAPATHSA